MDYYHVHVAFAVYVDYFAVLFYCRRRGDHFVAFFFLDFVFVAGDYSFKAEPKPPKDDLINTVTNVIDNINPRLRHR